MNTKKKLAAAVAAAGLLTVVVSQSAAQADTNTGSLTTLAMTGSDTSQDVMEGLSSVITVNGAPALSNYKATPVGGTITTRTGNANCTFTRPNNSGAGRNALASAVQGLAFGGSTNVAGCVDVARSSSGGNPSVATPAGTLTYVPFATDSVSYAYKASTTVPKKINLNTLKQIYTAMGTPGSAQCLGLAPLIPTNGSGTRDFFATVLGLTNTALPGTGGTTWGSCVRDVTAAGTAIQEHDGRFLTAGNQLVPFSTAQWIGQSSNTISDIRGDVSLGSIDFTSAGAGTGAAAAPVLLNESFGNATRPLYNVVPTAETTNGSLTQTVFVGATSEVCKASGTIQRFGLATRSDCGSTTKTNT